MLIDIDLNEAKRLKLTVSQFLLIKFVLDKLDYPSYQNVIQIKKEDIDYLIQKKIFTKDSVLTSDLQRIEITEDFKDILNGKSFFDEFYELYPSYVIRTDGAKDWLRTDVNRCRKKYNLLVGKSAVKHKQMIDALLFDLSQKRATNSMKYLKRMFNWLSSEEYVAYSEAAKEIKLATGGEVKYGDAIE